MGLEKTCAVATGGREESAKVRLEPGEVIVGPPFKLRVPLADVKAFEARGGELRLTGKRGTLALALGADAEKWALKIRYPRGRLDKLGVKPGMRVAVIGIEEAAFGQELRERTKDVSEGRARKDTDIVVVGLTSRAQLAKLRALRGSIKRSGAIWVVWPKGQKELREDDVRAQGRALGLVDVKVMGFSDTLSALKMVIPVKER